jgi:hypothetical protein
MGVDPPDGAEAAGEIDPSEVELNAEGVIDVVVVVVVIVVARVRLRLGLWVFPAVGFSR